MKCTRNFPVPVPMSAIVGDGGSFEVIDGCRRYPIFL